jgi:hypothetical protein
LNKVVNPLYKLLPSEKLNLRGKNGAIGLHPMASDFFFQFKKIRISVSFLRIYGQNGKALELGLETLHVDMIELGVSVRMILATLQVFLVRFGVFQK